jgi:hypothetical protein
MNSEVLMTNAQPLKSSPPLAKAIQNRGIESEELDSGKTKNAVFFSCAKTFLTAHEKTIHLRCAMSRSAADISDAYKYWDQSSEALREFRHLTQNIKPNNDPLLKLLCGWFSQQMLFLSDSEKTELFHQVISPFAQVIIDTQGRSQAYRFFKSQIALNLMQPKSKASPLIFEGIAHLQLIISRIDQLVMQLATR